MKNPIRRFSNSGMFPAFFDRYLSNDFFNNFFEGNSLPAVNIKEGKKDYKVELSVPGFEKEDIEVEIDGNTLKISANKETKIEEKDNDEKVIRQEFSSSSFSRSFTIPNDVDTVNINAKEKNGVLTLTLPKMKDAVENKTKKIQIG